MESGTNKIRLLTELKNIVSIEKTFYKSNLFHSKNALKISSINREDYSRNKYFFFQSNKSAMFKLNILEVNNYYLCLENEINVWYILIQELCFAIKFSKQLLDKSLIQYAAKNVLLADAVLARLLFYIYVCV